MSVIPFDLSLYLVANRPSFHDENLFFSQVKRAVEGGVTCVQLRDHVNGFYHTYKTAQRLKEMMKPHRVSFFVNTLHPFVLAEAVKADGVYLEERFSYAEARKMLGPHKILGVCVKTKSDVLSVLQAREIDYVSVKISPSNHTCPYNDRIWGWRGLRWIRGVLPQRIVAIGGLTLARAEAVYKILHATDGIAMAGGLMREEDPRVTAQRIQAARKK